MGFFVWLGVPHHLATFDADGLPAGVFHKMCILLQVPFEAISEENHKAVCDKCFCQCSNEVESINVADTGPLSLRQQGVMFALCAWNAGPVDGTNISQSLAVLSGEFPFPVVGDLPSANTRGDSLDPRGRDKKLSNILSCFCLHCTSNGNSSTF